MSYYCLLAHNWMISTPLAEYDLKKCASRLHEDTEWLENNNFSYSLKYDIKSTKVDT